MCILTIIAPCIQFGLNGVKLNQDSPETKTCFGGYCVAYQLGCCVGSKNNILNSIYI